VQNNEKPFCFVPIIRDMNAITREAQRGIIMGSNGAKIIVTIERLNRGKRDLFKTID